MSYSQRKLDEINDKLIELQGDDPALDYFSQILDRFDLDVIDMLVEKNKERVIKFIRKQIKEAREDLNAIPDAALKSGIETVRRNKDLDDTSDEEIENKYEDEVNYYAVEAQNALEENFMEDWEDLMDIIGDDFRSSEDLSVKIKNIDEPILEYLNEVDEEYIKETKEAFKEVFDGD